MEKDNWIMLYSSPLLYKVEMMKMLLEEENIDCVIVNNQDSSYLFGYVELYVQSTDVMKANTIIKNAENKK
jgi:hypothetical protein